MPQGPLTTYNRTVQERETPVSIGVAWPKRGISSLFLQWRMLRAAWTRKWNKERPPCVVCSSRIRDQTSEEKEKGKGERETDISDTLRSCAWNVWRETSCPLACCFDQTESRLLHDNTMIVLLFGSLKGTRCRDQGAGLGHSGNIWSTIRCFLNCLSEKAVCNVSLHEIATVPTDYVHFN